MKTNPKPWDRKLWGVVLDSATSARSLLIGDAWDKYPPDPKRYADEPSRVLIFRTRAGAKAWCNAREVVLGWKYRVVRVRELVEVIR